MFTENDTPRPEALPTNMERVADALHQLVRGGNPLYLERGDPQAAATAATLEVPPVDHEKPEPRPDNGWSGTWD